LGLSQNLKTLKTDIESLGGQLIAVSKKHDEDKIKEAFHAGQIDFAENYLKEAKTKIKNLESLNIRWHYIGRVQTGNLNKLINSFYLIHSISKIEHLKKINERTLNTQKILLQLRMDSDDREEGLRKSDILSILESELGFDKVDFSGLMFMPPPHLSDKDLESAFSWASRTFDELSLLVKSKGSWDVLSMGMSGDYKIALKNKASHVRLGTAIFGSRG
jgi:pyridoxal phosphate enzyme (YggS family)